MSSDKKSGYESGIGWGSGGGGSNNSSNKYYSNHSNYNSGGTVVDSSKSIYSCGDSNKSKATKSYREVFMFSMKDL